MLNALHRLVDPAPMHIPRPLLIITEGVLDIPCITKLSQIFHAVHPKLPDLQQLANRGQAIFLPAGGGDLASWATRLAPLGCPEFFLFDREQQPETEFRQTIVERINERPGCRAALTKKRSLENYLHPAAINATFGITIEMTDNTPVAEFVARAIHTQSVDDSTFSRRHLQRLIYRTKRRLNIDTPQFMTADLLAERDPTGEVVEWFRAIAALLA